jgi:hypothetical protein
MCHSKLGGFHHAERSPLPNTSGYRQTFVSFDLRSPKENKMKTFRFLILTVFVLSFALSSAPAKAAGQSLVYLALATRADSQIPVAVQAQREFSRLAPRLLSAQESGQLIDFNTEFGAGIIMLRFAGRADEAADAATQLFGRTVYSNVREALQAVPRQRPSRNISTVIRAQFYIDAYESCFWGEVPLDSYIVAILRDDAGVLQAQEQVEDDDDGDTDGLFSSCFDWSYYNEVVPGYRVVFRVFDTAGGTLLGTFATTAPTLTFTSLNKTTAQVAGTGPAGKAFDLFWSQPKLNAAGTYAFNTVSGAISAARTWSDDVSLGKIRGDAYIAVTVHQTPNIAFRRDMLAARIFCRLGGNFCDIQGFPYQPLTLKIIKGATIYTFSGRADAFGWFGVNLHTPAGLPIKIRAGDKVEGTNVARYTQPVLSLNAFDFVNDIVSGKAPPSRFFGVGVNTESTDWQWYWAGSNALGNFAVDTTADFDLDSTEISEAEVWYTDPVTGNITGAYRLYVP